MKDLGLDLKRTAVLTMDFQDEIVAASVMAQEQGVIPKVKAVGEALSPLSS